MNMFMAFLNTNTKFDTCHVAAGRKSVLVYKRAGELMACKGFIIYFIFICITASFLRSVKLWVVWVFCF